MRLKQLSLFLVSGFFLTSCYAMEPNLSPIEKLPPEIKLYFIDYLDIYSLLQLDQVSRHFHGITRDDRYTRRRCINGEIIHPFHSIPMGCQGKNISTYFQIWSGHCQWVMEQTKNMKVNAISSPDPLYYTNLKLGNEHAIKLFYPLFAYHVMSLYLKDQVTSTLEQLEEHLLHTLAIYGDQGSKNAQNALVLSYVLLYHIQEDAESAVKLKIEIPPLLSLIKKYADQGNYFLQIVLCDIYLKTRMVTTAPEYYLDKTHYNLHGMNTVFILGRLSSMILRDKNYEITHGAGIKKAITYAAGGNPYLQKHMVQTFFQGKYGFMPHADYGYMLLDRLLQKEDLFILAPLLPYLPHSLPLYYQKALREKLIADAMNGSTISQIFLVRALAHGKYYFEKSIDQAKEYALKFNLSPKKPNKSIRSILN